MPATAEHSRRYRLRLRLRLAVIFGIVCQHCGSNRQLEYAHRERTQLKGAGRGLTNRLLDVLKNPDSYLLLCRKCHRKFGGPEDWEEGREGEGVPF